MQLTNITSIDPIRAVEKQWNETIQEKLKETIWTLECGGW
jgi:hypothetical protein